MYIISCFIHFREDHQALKKRQLETSWYQKPANEAYWHAYNVAM